MANSGTYSVEYADISQLMISVCEIVLIVFKLWLGLTDFQNPGHGGEGCPPLITTLFWSYLVTYGWRNNMMV